MHPGMLGGVSDVRAILQNPAMQSLRVDRDVRVAEACVSFLRRASRRPVVLGLNGPQGCGKSTLSARVVFAMNALGYRAISCSIDDFYLTYDEQRALAKTHPGNRTMEYRGYPGTHDVALGTMTLDALVAGASAHVPRYNKAAHEGRGDRASRFEWLAVEGPLDAIIFEGWMLGFTPVAAVPSELEPANRALAQYQDWADRLDAMMLLRARALEDIVHWRVDAERARREKGEPALSEQESRDYIERFIPAYATWGPALWDAGVRGKGSALPICFAETLGRDRLPTSDRS